MTSGIVRHLRAGAELVRSEPRRPGNGLVGAVLLGVVIGGAGALVGGLPLAATVVTCALVALVARVYQIGGRFRPPVSTAFLRRLKPVSGERIALRPLTGADSAAVGAALDQKVIAEMGWTDAHVSSYGEFLRHPYLLSQLGHMAVCELPGMRVLGEVSIADVDERNGTAEMGVWLGPEGRGRGLGTELFQLAFAAYHQAGLQSIYCGTNIGNQSVQRILPRVGAILLDERPHRLPNDTIVDAIWFEHRAGASLDQG